MVVASVYTFIIIHECAVITSSPYLCLCSLLLGNPDFKDSIFHSTSGLGDHKLARVGRPATDYNIVVGPWESGIQPCTRT